MGQQEQTGNKNMLGRTGIEEQGEQATADRKEGSVTPQEHCHQNLV